MTPSAHCCLSLTCLALRKVATLGALSVAMILSIVVWSSFAPPARAQEAKSDGRGKLILTNLPPRGSKAYKDLLRLAGKEAKGQVLNLTQAEMWSMPESKIDGVVRQGASMGVKITKLGADWNHVLKSPGAPMAMNSLQQSIMKSVEGAKETMGVGMMATPSAAVVEYALMKDHEGKNRTLPSVIVIPLDDKQSITVRRTSVNMKKDGCTWHGEVEGTGESVMLMWWKGGRFNGMFTYRGTMYTLKNMGGQAHAVVATDPGKMPPDHGSMKSKSGPSNTDVKDDPLVSRGEGALMREWDRANIKDRQDAFGGAKMPSLDASPPPDSAGPRKITPISAAQRRALAAKKVRIDVMILYTGKVASNYIETEKDLIALSVAQANQSFANSGIGNLKLNLVQTQAVDYNEGEGEHFDHLYAMVDGTGPFKGLRKLRNDKRADVVALIVDDPSGCGLSTRVAADADEAFVVVHHACAALTYSVAHEIGHIIGARHDMTLDRSTQPFPYGHGYVNGTKWRDVMSYKASCNGCPRQPFWSNPAMRWKGEPAGALDADNARVILEQAERVAKVR